MAPLLEFNTLLLTQAIDMIERLQNEASADFSYGQAIGPHLRHILEHYQALMAGLASPVGCVDYDARPRDLRVQADPGVALVALRGMIEQLNTFGQREGQTLSTALTTRILVGTQGEHALTVTTSLGRELIFLSSHTVHHYALMSHYCKAAGVDLGHDFGKAPATVAFEKST